MRKAWVQDSYDWRKVTRIAAASHCSHRATHRIDLIIAYVSVDRSLPLDALAQFGVPPRMLAVIRQLHDGMQAFVWLDDGSCSYKVRRGARSQARMRARGTAVEHAFHGSTTCSRKTLPL